MTDDELNTSNNSFNEGFYCEVCERTFTRRYSLQRHNKLFHDEESEEDAMSDAEEHEIDQSTEEDEMSANEASSDEDEEQEEDSVTAMFRKLLAKVIDKDLWANNAKH